MLKFYMDESGLGKNPDEKVCGIAGFVTQNSSWKGFQKQWAQLLTDHRLDEFKSKEFWARNPRGGLCGKYADWSFDKANDFISTVVRLLISYKPHLLAGSIKIPDFRSYSVRERRFLTGGQFDLQKKEFVSTGKPNAAYFVALSVVVIKGMELAKNQKDTCHFVFDEQTEFAPLALKRIRDIREDPKNATLAPFLGDTVFSSSIKVLPLQVADLAAFTCKEYYKKVMYGQPVEIIDRAVVTPIEVFQLIVAECPHTLYPLDRVQMDKILENSEILDSA
jgi:hypothetical protein